MGGRVVGMGGRAVGREKHKKKTKKERKCELCFLQKRVHICTWKNKEKKKVARIHKDDKIKL